MQPSPTSPLPLLLLLASTNVLASPHAFANPADAATSLSAAAPSSSSSSAPPAASNGTQTRKGHRNKHHEHTPVFKTECGGCVKPLMPVGILSEKEKCHFRYYQDISCYNQAQGGCPSPVLQC